LPLAGCAEDFHPQVIRLATTAGRTAPVTALRAMPGAPKKNPNERLGFNPPKEEVEETAEVAELLQRWSKL
ncbi:hypothetical protein, partial [Paraburkholderia tuberum]|uniref:hypothetical protein n=1 Tax=Paraburkholderia tuberum TaxID=157910 RepID=UPI001ABBFABD